MLLPIGVLAVQMVGLPSQVELNGFLLGQHRSVVDATFGAPVHVENGSDGWVDRVFYTDSTETAYMVFGFTPERPDYVASIQLTGRYQQSQTPFGGLSLGAKADDVTAVLGAPTDRVSIPDWIAERWEYPERNYSVEVDTTGQLVSIRLTGYKGIPVRPDADSNPLQDLVAALRSRDPRGVMMVLAPDFEIYRTGEVFRYEGAALSELADSTGMLWNLLVGESRSLRAVLGSADTAAVEVNVRLTETGLTGLVYKFPETSPLQEIFFISYAGRWTAWEITFR